MNKRLKFMAVLTAPILALGLAACQTPNSSTTPPVSSQETPSTSVVPPSTSTGGGTSSVIPSTPVSSSTDSTSSSTETPLIDEIVGTSETRKETFASHEKGETASFYAMFMTKETFDGGNSNAYFLDGSMPYRVINVADADFADLVVGKVYKVTGQYNNESTINQKDSPVALSLELIENGESKISGTILDLGTTEVAASNKYGIAQVTNALVTATNASKKQITISTNSQTYTLGTRGLEEDAVADKFKAATVGVQVSFTSGVIASTSTINIIDAEAFSVGELKVYEGTIAQDAYKTGGVNATVSENVLTFAGGTIAENEDGKNYVGVTLHKPTDLTSTEYTTVKVDDGETTTWSSLEGADSLDLLVEVASKADITIAVNWTASGTAQNFTLKFADDVKLAETLAGTISGDPNADVNGAVTGSVDADHPLTVAVEGDIITIGAEGETVAYYLADEALGRAAGNRVGVQINKPEGAVASQIKITIGAHEYTWEDAKNGEDYFWYYPLVTEAGQQFTVTCHWADDTSVFDYTDQVFTIKVGAGVLLEADYQGSVNAVTDDNGLIVGSVSAEESLSAVIDGNTVTFGGANETIAWADIDAEKKLPAGNRIGIKITEPSDYPPSLNPLIYINGVKDANVSFGDNGILYWYPTVNENNVDQEQTIEIHWSGREHDENAQVITVRIATGTTLEEATVPVVNYYGSIAQDAAQTGGVTATVENYIITFAGIVSQNSEGKNCVAVTLTKPENLDTTDGTTVSVAGSAAKTWAELGGNADTLTLTLDLTALTDIAINVTWVELTTPQVFTVKFASDVRLSRNLAGTILGDPNADVNGAVTGSVDADHPLTVAVEGDIITIGADGETVAYYPADEALGRAAGNRVGVQINKPEGAVDSEIRITIGQNVYTWAEAQSGENFIWYYPLVTEAGQQFTVTCHWADDTTVYDYTDQVFTIKVGTGVILEQNYVGTIDHDPNSDLAGNATGSIDADHPLTITVFRNTITFGKSGDYIDYYPADEALGRAAGNRVGVQITKPSNLPSGVVPLLYVNGSTTPINWVEDAEGVIWWYPLITADNIGQEQTMRIHWSGRVHDENAQTFVVKIAAGTKLVGPYLSQIVDSTIDEVAAKTDSEYDVLYRVTGVVSKISNTTYGNLYLTDSETGTELYVYGLMSDKSVFYDFDGTKAPSNDKSFADTAIVVGDKITVVGVQYYFNTTHELTGYVEKVVKATDYTIDLSSAVTVNDDSMGSVTLSSTSAHFGDEIAITIIPNDGYLVFSVSVNGEPVTLTDGKAIFTVTAKNDIVVTFDEAVNFSITVMDFENGTATVDKTTGVYGDIITVTVTPATDYEVKTVTANGISATVSPTDSNVYTFILTSNTEVVVTMVAQGSVVKGNTYQWSLTEKIETPTFVAEYLTWTITPTWKAGSGYYGYDGTKGAQFGSGSKPASVLEITTSDYTDGIDKIVVNTSGASKISCTLAVTVGGIAIGETIDLTATATEYVFESSSLLQGEIKLVYTNTSSKAIYLKSITINPAA